MSSQKYYFNVPAGHGGIYAMPITKGITQPSTSAIGTFFFGPGVGIYVRLNDNECFFAHIVARTEDRGSLNSALGDDAQWVAAKNEGKSLTGIIKEKLKILNSYLPKGSETRKGAMKTIMVMQSGLGAQDTKDKGHRTLSDDITQGIKDFFSDDFDVYGGFRFAKNHTTGEETTFPLSETLRWAACNKADEPPIENEDWNLIFREGKWEKFQNKELNPGA